MFRFVIIFLMLSSQLQAATTIESLYYKAKKYNPSIKRVKLEGDFQKARISELKSAFYPELSFQGTYFYGNVPLSSEVGRSGFDRIDTQNAISLNARLYNGGSEYTYFKFKEILPALAKHQVDSNLFQFFLQLSAIYFDYLSLGNQAELISKQLDSLKERSKILKKWSEIGRVRKADYLSTMTQMMALEGQLQQIYENQKVAKLNLKALTGQNIDFDTDRVIEQQKYTELPNSWGRKIEERPEYKVLEKSISAQMQNLTIQKSSLRPQIDFTTNYYLDRRRFGRQDDWDVAISLRWNFYDFGRTRSRVQQEKVRLLQLQSDLQTMKINLTNEMLVVEEQFRSMRKRREILKSSYEVAKLNYEEQSDEFGKGLIDAIDLNRSLEQMIQAQLAYESMKFTLAEHWYALKLISGDIKL